MAYILVFWTVVGYAGAGTQYTRDWQKEYDWRPIGEFRTIEYCQKAAADLAIPVSRYRCIQTGVPSQ